MLTSIVQRMARHVGGLTVLGMLLGISRNAFYHWKMVPAKRVLELEKLTGIPRHEMRPDLYPPEDYHEQPEAHADAR
jgi:DNA-binding transcriptional regulator YdaS (Cro superfamily)